MPPTIINVRRIRRRELKKLLKDIPSTLSGKKPDTTGFERIFYGAITHNFYTKIHKAFLAKSDGGKDEFGDSWKPLKKSTIAQRPVSPAERKAAGTKGLGRGGRGLLTAEQNRQWKGIFASTFNQLAPKVGIAKAKQLAAQLAWAILKSRGARTKLEAYGNRKVPILRVSDRLSNSLKPGVISSVGYQARPDQIFESGNGKLELGTEVPYAKKQHKTRRLWPSLKKMTKRWLPEAILVGIRTLSKRLDEIT